MTSNASCNATTAQQTPPAPHDAGGDRDLGALLVRHLGEKLEFCRGKLVLDAPADCEIIACPALCEVERFNGIIDRYAARFPEADRRAVVSLWTLYYFATLTISTAVAWLTLKRYLPVALGQVSVCLDRETAAPVSFLLPDFGQTGQLTIHDAMKPLLRNHIEPLAEAIAAHTQVSKKLLWGNAAGYLDWVVQEAGHEGGPVLAEECAPLFGDATFPDGAKNPLYGTIRPMTDENGVEFRRRKVCCLRYCLPEIGGCGQSCPLPQGRR